MSVSKRQSDCNPIEKPDRFRRIGIWCSGASTEALYPNPTEWNKFAINGYIILMTAVLSFISGSYFLTYVFQTTDWSIPLLFGVVWSFLIFTLDRSIIVSIKKTDNSWQEFRQGSIRIILAFFIGLVIATPIELRLFELEIKAKVIDNQRIEDERRIGQSNKNLEERLKPVQGRLKELEKIRNEYYRADSICTAEIEGLSATGKVGKGPAWREKENTRIGKLNEWNAVKNDYNSLQKQIREISEISEKYNQSNNDRDNTSNDSKKSGVEESVKALYQLSGIHWFLTVLFILIECLPVITKLMNKRGSYDETLERIEYEKVIEQKEIISRKNSEINEHLRRAEEAARLSGDIMIQKQKDKLDAELANNKIILDTIAKYQLELALEAIEKWHNEQKEQLSSATP
ncbi:MAG: DUF4407 domain-containing protein [Bacteroidales bacterium]|jgi:hypothetical protein|nr:DUF4407 domain-containing protein [Bacteroidales bacterium]